ncbi:MAG TPA: hypothetical protein VIO11_01860, partial [Candidatus Methanoperedens sp.]
QGDRKGFKTEIYVEEFGSIKSYFTEKMSKLLDIILYNIDKQGYNGRIEFSLRQWLLYIGRKITNNNLKDAHVELKPMLEALHNIKISSSENRKRGADFYRITPFSYTEIKRGKIVIGFEKIFIESIDKRYFMLPKEIGLLKNTAYYIACYIFLYARKCNKNEFNLTYEALYEYCPSLPRYEEVISKDGAITQKIIEPFLKSLFQIKEKLGDNIKLEESQFEESKWADIIRPFINIEAILFLQSSCTHYHRL